MIDTPGKNDIQGYDSSDHGLRGMMEYQDVRRISTAK